MTKFTKAVCVAGILIAAFATDTPASLAAQPEKAVAEGQASVTTQNTSAVTYWVNEASYKTRFDPWYDHASKKGHAMTRNRHDPMVTGR